MVLIDLNLIELTVIQPLIGRRLTKPTKAKWRSLAGIPKYCRLTGDADKAACYIAIAMLRMECPNKQIGFTEAMAYVVRNREKVKAAVKCCEKPLPLKIDDEVKLSADECIALLAEQTMQQISVSTLRRWSLELGISYVKGYRFDGVETSRLIQHCKQKRQERVMRGRKLGEKARESADWFKYCEVG